MTPSFPPADSDYDAFTMSDVEVITYAIHMCSVLIMWFCLSLLLYPDDTKRMSWSISFLNSLVMSVAAVLYMVKKLPAGFFSFTSYKESVFHGRDNVSVTVCLLFGVANVVDLLLGVVFYRDRLNILSSLVHHPVFAFITYYSVTGNFFGHSMTPFTQGFMWMMVEEIPTFVLALGSIFPAFRMDALFGVTFFLLRIVFHGYGTSYAILSKTDTPICAFMCMSMIFHVVWFYQWVVSYRRGSNFIASASYRRTTVTGGLNSPATLGRPPKNPSPSPHAKYM